MDIVKLKFFNNCTLIIALKFLNNKWKLNRFVKSKPTRSLVAMKVDLYELCTAYLADIFAAPNSLNLKNKKVQSSCQTFHEIISPFKAKLKCDRLKQIFFLIFTELSKVKLNSNYLSKEKF